MGNPRGVLPPHFGPCGAPTQQLESGCHGQPIDSARDSSKSSICSGHSECTLTTFLKCPQNLQNVEACPHIRFGRQAYFALLRRAFRHGGRTSKGMQVAIEHIHQTCTRSAILRGLSVFTKSSLMCCRANESRRSTCAQLMMIIAIWNTRCVLSNFLRCWASLRAQKPQFAGWEAQH